MPETHNICYNCFAERHNANGACLLCGYDDKENAVKYPVALKAGSILNGQYIVGRVLGQGGFGITYLAMDYQLKIKVAIKEYLPDGMATRLPDTTLVSVYVGEKQEHFNYGAERFLDEARVLAKFIGNRNIAGVKSYFTENNTSYFVMDYIEGISFKNYIKNKGGKIAYTDALRILLPVMDALSVVHREGFIHRDVTPDNIYITKDNEIKLLDFGSARYSLGDKSKSLDVILKAGYAPKEQYIRRGKQGPYTDIYSLAACFYASITGYLPPEALERMEEDEIVPISVRGIRIPDSLEDAIMKGLEVRAEDRWQSIEEFRAGINHTDLLPVKQTVSSVVSAVQAQNDDDLKITPEYVKDEQISEQASMTFEQTKSSEKPKPSEQAVISEQPKSSEQAVTSIQSEPDMPIRGSEKKEQLTVPTSENILFSFINKNKVASIISIVACFVAVTSMAAVIIFALIKSNESRTENNNLSDSEVVLNSDEYESDTLSNDIAADVMNPQSEDTVLAASEGDEATQNKGSSSDSEEMADANGEADETEADITETDKVETEIAENDQTPTADQAAADKAAADKAAADQAAADKAAADKAAADKAAADKAAADKAAADKAAADKAAADKAAADKAAADKAAADKATDNAETDKIGNSVGNLVNGGELAEQDGWIYYSNTNSGKLYKVRSNGKEVTKLSDNSCLYINIVDKWVYYWNRSDSGIYKIRTDGTKETKLSEDEGWYINVVDGWVYYGIFPITGSTGLYKIRTDGTEKTKLSDDECSHINVVDNWVYYRNGSDSEKIYKIRTDGTEKTKLSDDAYGFINVVDGWIYYMYGLYAKNGDDKLYKMRTDGTEVTKLSDDECSFVNVADNWVYYVNYSDDGIYKVSTDGTKKTKISDYEAIHLYVAGGWVYYDNSSDDGKFYQISVDGSER